MTPTLFPAGWPPARSLPLLLALSLGATSPALAADPHPPAAPPAPASSTGESSPSAAPPSEAGREGTGTPVPAEPDGVRRVVYLPETVRLQLLEELKKEVQEQARRERWAQPDLVPYWVPRTWLSGDLRTRFDRAIFPAGNANNGEFPDFNAINTGGPFDVKGVDLANDRYLDVDRSRTRPRLRARLGLDVELSDGFSTRLRLASGDNSSPVSGNQTLGGSGGGFAKYPVWIDRAYLKYRPPHGDRGSVTLIFGRFDNPFLGTDLLWWEDLGFDGAALQGRVGSSEGLQGFLNGGAFPVYTTAFGYPGDRTDKYASWNKWLYAAQVGLQWAPGRAFSLKLAGAFYDFDGVEGHATAPCDTNIKTVSCDGDESRPAFAQKGNTYLALRTPSVAALAAEASAQAPRYQYFGLASRFRELAGTARLEAKLGDALDFGLDGEYVRNLGFHRKAIEDKALNNRGPLQGTDPLGPFVGGNRAWLARTGLGPPALGQAWRWQVRLAYRWIESDALVDAFNDPDFGLGGTNLKGYSVDATLWLTSQVSLAARWSSADQVAGPKYAVDVLQVDLQGRF
jgi:hypothetical protein